MVRTPQGTRPSEDRQRCLDHHSGRISHAGGRPGCEAVEGTYVKGMESPIPSDSCQ